MEGSLRSVDPLAYLVNNLADFDPEIVKAYKNKNNTRIDELACKGQMDMDLFICVNKGWHGFILCAPNQDDNGLVDKSPFDIPSPLKCWQYELLMGNEELRWYKIRREFKPFRDIEGRIQRYFYIGRFRDSSENALQFAAMRAAPHRYNVLLEDCVEFAKEFCVQALAYCSNWHDLEEEVHSNIAKATASGFSVEKLSRNIRSSGWVGHTFIGGIDVSDFLSNRFRVASAVCLLLLLLVYPIVIAVITVKLMK